MWRQGTKTTESSKTHHCKPFTLSSLGILTLNPTYTITLETNAVFQPECPTTPSYHPRPSSISDVQDPFYASTIPLAYAISAATVLSYMLFIMLLITPRTFFSTGAGGGSSFLGRRGLIGGSSTGDSIVGAGRRPWLQKLAALTVVISLTIASANTFRVAERQYNAGVLDAGALRDEVVEGLEIRIVRVISDAFLWLAQVQTLVRLFPRHKEKLIIKRTGFALIVLDTLFAILNNFISSGKTRPRRFVDAIPALSYLFHISLSVLYSAWVVYYSISKSRFSFYHASMPNICLVAVLSLSAVLVPVVFFVLDISNPSLAGWGDYVRWVGAAAASVVVWEWVERIEALEREEKKGGVLGREIFDGDEMLEATHSEIGWPGYRRRDNGDGRGGRNGGTGPGDGHLQHAVGIDADRGGVAGIANRFSRSRPAPRTSRHGRVPEDPVTTQGQTATVSQAPLAARATALPPASSTLVSVANSTGATSTVYDVHHHTVIGVTPPIPEQMPDEDCRHTITIEHPANAEIVRAISGKSGNADTRESGGSIGETDLAQDGSGEYDKTKIPIVDRRIRWHLVPNSFKRRRDEPPIQVAHTAIVLPEVPLGRSPPAGTDSPSHATGIARWDLKSRISSFATAQIERLAGRFHENEHEIQLPLRIIPAQPRVRNLGPTNLQNDQGEENGAADQDGENRDEAGAHHGQPSLEGIGVEPPPDPPGVVPGTSNNGSPVNRVT